MRLVRYRTDDGHGAVGVRTTSGVVATGENDMIGLIGGGQPALERVRAAADDAARAGDVIEQLELLAPLPRSGRMFFCGVNYGDHVREVPGRSIPPEPSIFAKTTRELTVSGDPIVLPRPDIEADYEGELAMVVGSGGAGIDVKDALDHVFGYLVLNDVSARDLQFGRGQLTLGKGMDTFCPIGTDLVTADEIADPLALSVSTWVNGELRQDASTSEMIYSPQEVLSFLTTCCTLEPGDVISTGTPAGVGAFRDPPVFLRPGDRIVIEIPGVGRLENPVIGGW